MQNAFVSPGGYLDRAGFDITAAPPVVAAVAEAAAAARAAGLPVFWFQNGIDPAQRDVAPGSPWFLKSPAMRLMRRRPELAGQVLTVGSWDHAIVDALAPPPGDIVMSKTRPSCFAGTHLDMMLRARGVRTIVVIGIASNVGVEWTLRDGLSREYFGLMLEDATMPAGPASLQAATVFNIETFVGWVATVRGFAAALAARAGAPQRA
ncbi:MAG: isochorismatase family protein [Rhodospirillaceae bacterium]|nr:isochorismatase family protein [Rhodospirillaceae bacterium]